MAPIIQFKCRACEHAITTPPLETNRVSCPSCRSSIEVFMNESVLNKRIVTICVSCGHDALYVQKDFNRKLGVGIVGAGIAASIYFFAAGEPFYAMAILFVSAIVDFLLYRVVKDVTVCYACHAVYRGFESNATHEPFDLKKLEKYGGRDPRIG